MSKPVLLSIILILAVPLVAALDQSPTLPVKLESSSVLRSVDFVWPKDAVSWAGQVVVSDVGRGKLYFLSPNGEPESQPELPIERTGLARSQGDALVVEDRATGTLVYLNLDKEQGRWEADQGRTLALRTPRQGFEVDKVYEWHPLAEGALIFADFQREGEWYSGFLFVGRDDQLTVLKHWKLNTEALVDWYIRTPGYIAVSSGVGYFLAPSMGRMAIFSFSPGSATWQRIGFVPEPFDVVPRLNNYPVLMAERRGPERAFKQYQDIQEKTAVMGIYPREGELFLLAKEVEFGLGNPSARWFLLQFRLVDNELNADSKFELPTRKPSLLVTPNAEMTWYLLERGPVVTMGASKSPYARTSTISTVSAISE